MARRAVFAVSVIALGGFGATAACGASGNGAPPTGDAGRADTSQRPAPDSSDDEPSPPRDAATPRDAEAALDDWSDAGTCNSLITTAPFLPVVSVAQPLPPMTGGDVDPGTYELTKLEFFMGADGDAGPPTDLRSQTWRVGPAVDGGLALEVAGASRDINGAVGRGRASFVLTPDQRSSL